MNHPTNKAQFLRHLEQNPHLVYRSPGKVFGELCQDVFEGRLWTKTTSKRCQFLMIGTDNHGRNTFMEFKAREMDCLLYTSPSPRDRTRSRMPSSA